jgi:hypothetical protein
VKRVYIASPFRGSSAEETRQNIVYARLCMLDSLERGEAPYLSHLLYTQAWSEQRRSEGLAAGDAWREVADLVALYTDLGESGGMQRAVMSAVRQGIPTATRSVHWRDAGALDHLDTPAAWRARLALLPLDGFPELG